MTGGERWHCAACHGWTDDRAAGQYCSDREAPPSKRLVCPARPKGGSSAGPHRWVPWPVGEEPQGGDGATCVCWPGIVGSYLRDVPPWSTVR